MYLGQSMEVCFNFFDLDPIWAMLWGSWLEISKRTLTRRYRQAGGLKMEWTGTWGMRWGFHQEFSFGPELGEVEGCLVEKLNGPQLGYVIQVSVGYSEMDPDSEI